MTTTLPGLQIDSPLITPRATNFRPSTWPPPGDFPVVVGANGAVISRYSDSRWDLTPWIGTTDSINFGDGPTNGAKVSPRNATIFRHCTAWLLWGPDAVRSPSTLATKHGLLKHLFVACSDAGIVATDLWRHPRVIEDLAARLPRSSAFSAFAVFNDLWAARDELGFVMLDQAGLSLLAGLLPERESTQTAYIPPRIWRYQVLRLRECLDDFHLHREAIESCYHFCLDAYAVNVSGDLSRAFGGLGQWRLPFGPHNEHKRGTGGRVFYGAFRKTARRYGVEALLDRWVNASDANGIKALTNYFTLINYVGLAYLLSFSLMRVDEASKLRADCYHVERDPVGDDIHLVRGMTTKTVQDSAQWIVSPGVRVAIDAMTRVAHLRMAAAKHDPKLTISSEDASNPILQSRAHEPWAPSLVHASRKRVSNYLGVMKSWPKLFSRDELRITEEDLRLARTMTFGLDPERFAVGKTWPLAWHQLRRTGAVNMLASGLVSDASLQYQLKHATRAMSRYYGQNYYRLNARLDDEARGYYLREMYESLVREFEELHSGSYISPYGEKRKEQILAPIATKDHARLLSDAKAGRVTYRQTFLGGCAKPGIPCDLGGISNISGCLGHGRDKACQWALVDRNRRAVVAQLRDVLLDRLKAAAPIGFEQESLKAQLDSAERALHVIDSQ